MKIVVIGGTGLIGSKLVSKLRLVAIDNHSHADRDRDWLDRPFVQEPHRRLQVLPQCLLCGIVGDIELLVPHLPAHAAAPLPDVIPTQSTDRSDRSPLV
jgi:nucleoside-diphosphate-sugar epimerase